MNNIYLLHSLIDYILYVNKRKVDIYKCVVYCIYYYIVDNTK